MNFRFVMNLVLNHSVRVSHSNLDADAPEAASASASGVSPTYSSNPLHRMADKTAAGRHISFKASSPDEKAFLEAARR